MKYHLYCTWTSNGPFPFFFFFLVPGISYLSRAQESIAKAQMGCQTLTPNTDAVKSSSEPSVFDTIFVQRVKSRVKNWKDAYDSSSKTNGNLQLSIAF